MEKLPATMMKEFINSQKFESTADVMATMKEMFGGVLQQVMECEPEEKLGCKKSERVSDDSEIIPKRLLEKDSENTAWRGGYSGAPGS